MNKSIRLTISICLIAFLLLLIILQQPWFAEGMQNTNPYVLSNTVVESSPDHLQKTTYMEDTCGNFLSSEYNSVIHSLSKFFQSSLPSAPLTANDCEIYQDYTTNETTGKSSCTNKCQDMQQYFDTTSKTCRFCPIGYTNDGNNNCIPLETCPYDLKYIDNTKNCVSCPIGKHYDDTINCVDICLPYETYQPDGTCSLKCPSRMQYYDKQEQTCKTCPAGYLDDDHNNCVPAPTCPPGQILDVNQNCVAKCTENWTRFDVTSNTCVPRCSDGQQLKDNQCVDCPSNTMSDGINNCIPKPTEPPPKCHQGYQYDSVQKKCVTFCQPGYKNNLYNPLQCDPLCYGYSFFSNGTCIPCPDGKMSDGNNGCKDIPTPSPTPLVCSPGYQVSKDSATGKETCQSICPPNRINNKLNPLLCDFVCQDPNDVYSSVTKQCQPCSSNETPNEEHTQCVSIAKTPGDPVTTIDLGTQNLSSQYSTASWIWNTSFAATAATPNQYMWFYRNFAYKGNGMMGQIYALVNNVGALYINGQSVGSIGSNIGASGHGTILPITLAYGLNQIKVAAYSTGGSGGLILVGFDGNGTQIVQTDSAWTYQCSQSFAGNEIIQCDNTSNPIIVSMTADAVSPTQITVTVTTISVTVNSVVIQNNNTGAKSDNLYPQKVTNDTGRTTYNFNNLTPNQSYSFTATAYSNNNRSTSSQQSAFTQNTPPPPPPPPTKPATIPPTTTPPPTTPPPWTSNKYGGSGGSPFDDTCPDKTYVTSLSGRAGAWVDGIRATCNNGKNMGYHGGYGGSQASTSCNNGMSGVSVLWGTSWTNFRGVGQLTPICADGTRSSISIGGGSLADTKTYDIMCPAGERVNGIIGNSGTFNDSFGIHCKSV